MSFLSFLPHVTAMQIINYLRPTRFSHRKSKMTTNPYVYSLGQVDFMNMWKYKEIEEKW